MTELTKLSIILKQYFTNSHLAQVVIKLLKLRCKHDKLYSHLIYNENDIKLLIKDIKYIGIGCSDNSK